ncbi:type II toxin-antitoxin system VapC family toxin [Aeoliella sp. SH292]|uniref:type II toxin-antitoxin system VapC family toxin n=1 Tax=Aeoliella sp. SH292 TaxID=3454464 RepID=UPI003F9AB3E8
MFSRLIQHSGRVSVSVVTAAELQTWTHRSNAPASRVAAIADLLAEVHVLDLDFATADTFGRVRAKQLDAGALSPTFDLLIAATAITHNLTHVTHNTVDCSKIPGLTFVDWLAP